eukprot:74103_1
MTTINDSSADVFRKLNEREDVTAEDVTKILSKMTNIVPKLIGFVSESSWHGHGDMALFLKRCSNEPNWQDNLHHMWLTYVDVLKKWPSEIEFEEKARDLQCHVKSIEAPLSMHGRIMPSYFYTSSIIIELKHLFYTECFHILNTENINEYDISNTEYKWPGEAPKLDIEWDKIAEHYDETATDEIIDLTSRQQNLLTCGFITRLNIKNQIIPSTIIYLCLEYVKFVNFRSVPNEKDTVNFVTTQDLKQCEIYRKKGNEYFKLKQYEEAITKYNKALFYNNDNHLVYNNLSLCYFNLHEFDQAKENALNSIKFDPSYLKAWVRLAMPCQHLKQYDIAFICIMVAYCITIKYDNKFSKYSSMRKSKLKASGVLHKLYCKTDELMVDNVSFEDQQEIESKVELFFDSNRYVTESSWNGQIMNDIMENDEEMKKFHEDCVENDTVDYDYVNKFMAHEIYVNDKVFFTLYQYYIESKWNNKYIMNSLKLSMCAFNVSYMSLKSIYRNKRWFGLNINEISHEVDENGNNEQRERNICGNTVCGKPTGQRLIKELLRLMAQRGHKPRWMFIAWRIRNEFEQLEKYFQPLGIQLMLEAEADAKKNAYEFGNDHDGWNHMIWNTV